MLDGCGFGLLESGFEDITFDFEQPIEKFFWGYKMKLGLNGKESEFADGLTVSELLVEEQVKTPEMVSVELNGQILKRSEFETVLKDGDKVEFLFFAAGGKCD